MATAEAQSKADSSSSSSPSISINTISPDSLTAAATATAAAPPPTATPTPSRPRSKHAHSHSSSSISKRRAAAARPAPSDPLSDRATAQLVRRVLCPPHQAGDRGRATPPPLDELLPPLTSRNDVDLQLYAIISIVLRDFVQTWYNKITPDEAFVAEIVQIIAHCTRALEQRLRKVDLESLLFDEIPELFDRHVQAYRVSRTPIVQPPLEVDARDIYHSLCPLPYLSPIPKPERPGTISEQEENEFAYRQLLVQGVLAVLLPTEDLENECLTSLVGQILSELIIGGVVVKKASEPWLIWTGLGILAGVLGRKRQDASRLKTRRKGGPPPGREGFSLSGLLWSLIHYIFAFTAFIRLLVTTVATSRTLPPRGQPSSVQKDERSPHTDGFAATDTDTTSPASDPFQTPVLDFAIWPMLSNLLSMDRHMPWLLGALSMVQWLAIRGPWNVGAFNGVVDRLLSDSINRHVLDPAMLPAAIRNLRGALFPNNAMGTQTLFAPESDQELRTLRRKCASALWALVPRGAGRMYFGGGGSSWLAAWFSNSGSPSVIAPRSPRSGPISDSGGDSSGVGLDEEDPDARIISEIEADILDVFSDPYCNKHLMYGALELVLVRLLPELAEQGVMELWEERLS